MLRLDTILLISIALLAACGGQAPFTPAPRQELPKPSPTLPAAQETALASDVEPATATLATSTRAPTSTRLPSPTPMPTALNPLTIESMRQDEYPGSDITIEEKLTPGANYDRYIASYLSEGYKIYGLLTVPKGQKPKTGWPVIIFNHGYIPPYQYKTTERYVAYVDSIARSGYIVFKSDYRGHGESEGWASGGYSSPAYTIDVLNALASIKHYPDADPNRIGMWGHSMGGQITLRAMVVSRDIKAGVIWGGVVASYPELLSSWRRATPTSGSSSFYLGRGWRGFLTYQYGTPEENPEFWASISPNTYVGDIGGPIQLHHGTADEEVPLKFSQQLYDELKAAGKPTEFYTYPGSNHNITQGFALAMQRTITFFNKYVAQKR